MRKINKRTAGTIKKKVDRRCDRDRRYNRVFILSIRTIIIKCLLYCNIFTNIVTFHVLLCALLKCILSEKSPTSLYVCIYVYVRMYVHAHTHIGNNEIIARIYRMLHKFLNRNAMLRIIYLIPTSLCRQKFIYICLKNVTK